MLYSFSRYCSTKSSNDAVVLKFYEDMRKEVLRKGINPVAALENFIRQRKLFDIVPEFKELSNIIKLLKFFYLIDDNQYLIQLQSHVLSFFALLLAFTIFQYSRA